MGSIGPDEDLDVLVIGSGISGVYLLHLLRKQGAKVKVLEAGSGVGGTWFWNRYPGARFDSESYTYCYSWSKELLDEWHWHEHFAPQPETERYLNHVTDKFQLRDGIQFDTRVTAAHFDEQQRKWHVTTESGQTYTTRFLVTAIGALSNPTYPRVPGIENFKGVSTHTARWPAEGIDYAGKRVAVIGTGATGIQTIQEVSKTAGSLSVFQRRPNWVCPLGNRKIDEQEMQSIRDRYDEIFAICKTTPGCFIHTFDPRGTFEVSDEEREAFWEERYRKPGFGLWMGNFRDVYTDKKANALLSDFVARKIRGRVHDPDVAEKLIPKNHGFGTRRVPLETKYLEVYNQPNVELVDLTEEPLERITEKGIKTTKKEREFDVIIYGK
jgi:cation diffusion facilitator CzcD-associated flavoprotein CzcO